MADAEEMLRYYGIIVPEKKFHISPLCPSLRTVTNWKRGKIFQYAKETEAILSGHLQRCPVCFNLYRFAVKVGNQEHEFLLEKQDITALLGMAELQKMGKGITITDLGHFMGLGFDAVNDTVKKLRRLKLVRSCEYDGNKQRRGKRKFTPAGIAVVLAYNAKLYGAPLSDQSTLPVDPSQINNSLF